MPVRSSPQSEGNGRAYREPLRVADGSVLPSGAATSLAKSPEPDPEDHSAPDLTVRSLTMHAFPRSSSEVWLCN